MKRYKYYLIKPDSKPHNPYHASLNMCDPTRDEMLAFLIGEYPDADGDEFDLEAAIYWFSSDYYGGQSSNLYKALCQSPYNPGPLMSDISAEGDIAEMLYNMLIVEFATK